MYENVIEYDFNNNIVSDQNSLKNSTKSQTDTENIPPK